MKKLLFLLCILASVVAFAFEVPIKGDFLNVNKDGIPAGWMRNTWSGYLPACDLVVIQGGGINGNSLRMSNVQNKNGAAFNSSFFKGICGDTVRLTFRARGRGNATVNLFFKTLDGEWNFKSIQEEKFQVSENWRNYTIVMKILNGKAGETGSYDVCFVIDQRGELEISDLKAEQTEGEYRGSEPFPQKWTLFGPVDKDFQPELAGLEEIPQELDGVKGQEFPLVNRTLDFANVFGAGQDKYGWAFAVLDSQIDCDYTIGAGADWWMAYYVNGELVIDTTETGNIAPKYDITNHIRVVRLHKGKNLLAVKLRSGKASSVLKLGGPLELQDNTIHLKLSKIEWTENFDGKELSCTGVPQRIQGYPTPGLLTLTGQAVFSTDGMLDIEQPRGSFDMPKDKALYRAIALRLQYFSDDTDGELDFVLSNDAGEDLRLAIVRNAGSDQMELKVLENGIYLDSRTVSLEALPAEIVFGVGASGNYGVSLTSLSNGSILEFSGSTPFAIMNDKATPKLQLKSNSGTAQVAVDNFTVGRAQEKNGASAVPYKVDIVEDFDPVKAGWQLVFDEEFDGDTLDTTKWFHSFSSKHENVTVHDGVLEIRADWNKEHTKLEVGNVHTYEFFGYGYFEARCKFRKEPGWWSAFWLYGATNSNPFYDGFEIDCYEDYFLTSLTEGNPARNQLDFNLHVYCGGYLKSWNFNSPKGDYLSDFHRVGVKWTPFEITYYLDGKLIQSRSPLSTYEQVTFDAFQNACGFTPLCAILSGQAKPSAGDPKRGNFPESFYTDYVRIYAYPQDEIPQIEWTDKPETSLVTYGDTLHFAADAKPSPKSNSPIKAAYLFCGGYLMDYKTEPPYEFDVMLTQEYYATTDYCRPGRQGIVPNFEKTFQSYSIFVQDEAGQVAHTEPYTFAYAIRPDTPASTPYQGKAQVIPGTVKLVYFDEGGNGVAYMDTTPGNEFKKGNWQREGEDVDVDGDCIGYTTDGEWLNYTVDIQEAGTYDAVLHYGFPWVNKLPLRLYLDNKDLGDFMIESKGAKTHVVNKTSTITVDLPAGRHVLKLFMFTAPNITKIDFIKK